MNAKTIIIEGMPYVKMSAVYAEIANHLGWSNDPKANTEESGTRLLRNKHTFLFEKAVLRNKKDFKYRGDAVIPAKDAPIVRDLLIESLSTEEGNMIPDWFNGHVDTSDSQQATLLYWQLKPAVMHSLMTGETDDVTVDEWLATLSAAINYTTAQNTIEIKKALEAFRNDSLGMDMNIGIGDIIVGCNDGSRYYASKDRKPELSIEGKTIDQMLDDVVSQDDYFAILSQILKKFDAHVKASVREKVVKLVLGAIAFDAKNMSDAISTESIASEYLIWYQRLHDYLQNDTEAREAVLRSIEAETNERIDADHLVELFDVQGRGKKMDAKKTDKN